MLYDKLSKLRLFQSISKEAIECLNSLNYKEMTYTEGELIAHFGDPIDYLFTILDGTLKTNEYTFEGKEIVSSYYHAYDAFPYYLVYSDVDKFPYNVFCHSDARVIMLPVTGMRA